MIEQNPLVSVVMPVYNGMPYLPDAVESILVQTFRDYELIIIDDCSTDGSYDYLKSLTDDRILIKRISKNKGVTGALQEGMRYARGKYIARLDSDDVALPERLRIQIDFLQSHADVGLLGSSFYVIDENNAIVSSKRHALTDVEIRWRMFFKNPFFHSSILFRKEIVEKNQLGYVLKHGEDYDLWTKILDHARGFILSDPLIQYRVSEKSWTFTKGVEQADASSAIAIKQIKKYIDQDERILKDFVSWVRGITDSSSSRQQMKALYLKLVQIFIQRHDDEITTGFVLNSLIFLRRRLGVRGLLNFDMFPLYWLFFKIKLRLRQV
jgi:glycosyltransferase involved in cell wall biosynthesis